MTEFTVDRPIKRAPTHPGELMREILEEQLRLSKTDAAERMRISRQSLYAVLNRQGGVTADMALRFGKLTGGRRNFMSACRPPMIYGRPVKG